MTEDSMRDPGAPSWDSNEISTDMRLAVALEQADRLRARIIELEAELARLRGSMAPTPAPDEPGTIAHDIPPNAPR